MHTELEQEETEERVTRELIVALDAAKQVLGGKHLEAVYDKWIVSGK